jgi:hypothetical protein
MAEGVEHVTRFEANLLRLLYFFLRREPPERALPLIENRCDRPACLKPNAVRLIRDALSKGCVHLVASRGGWRKERFLRREQPREGRLWERTPPEQLGLTFSPHTLDFLVWITTCKPGDRETAWQPAEADLSDGDRLLLFFAHEGLRETTDGLGTGEMRRRQPFASHALCWLAYPEDYANAPSAATPNFAPWMSGVGACLLEALQFDLARRWEQVEGSKEGIADARVMKGLGHSQERVLGAFLEAVQEANRLDLARFLLRALANVLGPHANSGMWTGRLNTTGMRVADRVAVYSAALVVMRMVARFQDWSRRARSVGYFDEGYAAAQLWKADWEQYQGDVLCERAVELIRQIDPMKQG